MRERFADGLWWRIALIVVTVLRPSPASAQTAASVPLSLNDAVQMAVLNYPAIKESRARAQAAEEGIGVARTAYLPRLDLVWQENRATTNNVFGLLLPQSVVPPISGPVLGTQSLDDSVWGSAAGVLLSWEAIDFGQRKAGVDVARAQTALAKQPDGAHRARRGRCRRRRLPDGARGGRSGPCGARECRPAAGVRTTPSGRWCRTSFGRAPINRAPTRNWRSRRISSVGPCRSRMSRGRRWPRPSARPAQSLELAPRSLADDAGRHDCSPSI